MPKFEAHFTYPDESGQEDIHLRSPLKAQTLEDAQKEALECANAQTATPLAYNANTIVIYLDDAKISRFNMGLGEDASWS